MSDQDIDSEAIEEWADVKIIASVLAIVLVIFGLALVGAVVVFQTVHRWFA